MTRHAAHAARLVAVVLGTAFGIAYALVLLGAPDGTTFAGVLHAGVFAVGAAFGAGAGISLGGASAHASAPPLLISMLTAAVLWWRVRRRPLAAEWVGVSAVSAGAVVWGAVAAVSGWHSVTVQASAAGLGVAVIVALVGVLAAASQRWSQVARPLDLVVLAGLAVIVAGLVVELCAGLSYTPGGSGGGPALRTDIALALAYAPNAGVAAIGLGLGGAWAVTGINSQYATFIARFIGGGPTAILGAPHGQGGWADALRMPGLASVYVAAPVWVLAIALSARFLRSLVELLIWIVALAALVVGLGFAVSMSVSAGYAGFVLGAGIHPAGWARIAGLVVLPVALAIPFRMRLSSEPRLDVGDGTRQVSRQVS